jgi:glucose-6-phosphate isomerase
MARAFKQTTAYKKLVQLKNNSALDLKTFFQKDPERFQKFSLKTDWLLFDFSRQLITDEIFSNLINLGTEAGLKEKIKAMFSGEKINQTENRAALHVALRNLAGRLVFVDGKDVMPEVLSVLKKIENFSSEVLAGRRIGFTGKKFKNIISVSIGGSALGPEYLAEALAPYAAPGMKLVFVSNVDGTDFARKTSGLNPEETLVVIVSKTFTTAETMKNAQTVRRWMTAALGPNPEVIKKHFVAVSAAAEEVKKFGIDPVNMFILWDWVGGRFSATSAVGALPLSLYLGFSNFKGILKGAHTVDQHFLNEPLEKNIPVIAGLLDIWNINFLGLKTRAILPYSQAWWKYGSHCQQTEMESNGKRVLLDGTPVTFDTGEVVFGEPGTNGQHSFYQLLHQGTQIIPADFIGFIEPQYALKEPAGITHHEELMSNFFAQPDALAFGKEDPGGHRNFPGNRPSNIFLLQKQNPFSAGVLLALLEHRAAVKGFIWGINSFDQFGVELGKVLGKDLQRRMKLFKKDKSDPEVFKDLNQSTAGLLKTFLSSGL